jgi:hypothetical protein
VPGAGLVLFGGPEVAVLGLFGAHVFKRLFLALLVLFLRGLALVDGRALPPLRGGASVVDRLGHFFLLRSHQVEEVVRPILDLFVDELSLYVFEVYFQLIPQPVHQLFRKRVRHYLVRLSLSLFSLLVPGLSGFCMTIFGLFLSPIDLHVLFVI